MNFSYTKYPAEKSLTHLTKESFVYRPFVVVDIGFGEKYVQTYALLDTGADYSLAPTDIAQYLGIDLLDCEEIPISGVGKGRVMAFFKEVRLRIAGKKIETYVGFGEFPITLLGQLGFFNKVREISFHYPQNFKINF